MQNLQNIEYLKIKHYTMSTSILRSYESKYILCPLKIIAQFWLQTKFLKSNETVNRKKFQNFLF